MTASRPALPPSSPSEAVAVVPPGTVPLLPAEGHPGLRLRIPRRDRLDERGKRRRVAHAVAIVGESFVCVSSGPTSPLPR